MNIDWDKYYILNLLITSVIFLILLSAKKILVRKITTERPILTFIKRTHILFILATSLYIGFADYDRSEKIRHVVDKSFLVAVLIQIAVWGRYLIEYSSRLYFDKTRDGSAEAAINLFNFIAKFCMYVVLFLMLLHNLNVDVTTLITGLGVGGIAIALAIQSILGDLFASMTIVLDKPFVVGDSIRVDDLNGTIEHIGMKTTRLRSIDGEQLIFSNTDLLKSRIKNFKRMEERRAIFTVGVTYETPKEQLRKIPTMIKTIIENQKKTRFDRSHFITFADSSLNFETAYWVLDSNFAIYRDVHQTICLELFEQFAKEGIQFAYPTQTVYETRIESKKTNTFTGKEISE